MPDTIPVEQLPQFLDQLGNLLEHPQLANPIHNWLTHLAGDLGQAFLSSRSPDGTPWPPLKRKRPKGHNPGHRPLIDFGKLLASVVSDGTGHVETVTDDSAEFGTSVDYAGYQNFGTSHIPAREFMAASDDMQDLAAELVASDLILQIQGL